MFLFLALLLFYFVGRVVFRVVCRSEKTLELGFFSNMLFGQLFAVCLFYLISPFLYFLSNIVDINILCFSLLLLSLSLVSFYQEIRKGFRVPFSGIFSPYFVFIFAATAIILRIVSNYSIHLGSSGHDNHQHIYWTYQILKNGYISLAAWHTNFLEHYPHGYHVLCALWGSLSPFDYAGAIVKSMPCLQIILVCLASIEIFAKLIKPLNWKRELIYYGLAFVLLCLFVFSFTKTVFIYPYLEMTGRLSSAGIVCAPLLLLLVCCLEKRSSLFYLSVFIISSLFVYTISINPVFISYYPLVVVSIYAPALVFAFIITINDRAFLSKTFLCLLAAFLMTLVFFCQDSWLIAMLLKFWPALEAPFEALTGLKSYSPVEGVDAATSSLACKDIACVAAIVLEQIQKFPNFSMHGSDIVPYSMSFFTEMGLFYYYKVAIGFWVLALISILIIIIRKQRLDGPLILFSLLITSIFFLSGYMHQLSHEILLALSEDSGRLVSLLAYYHLHMGALVGTTLFFVFIMLGLVFFLSHFLKALGILQESEARALGYPSSLKCVCHLLLFASIISASIYFIPEDLYDFKVSVRGQLAASDIKDFRQVEKEITDSDRVMLPTSYTPEHEKEKWIGTGRGRSGMPTIFSDRRIVFNEYLGSGYEMTWSDVRYKVCEYNKKQRLKFLREKGINRLFVWEKDSGTKQFYKNFTICGHHLASFKIKYPPLITVNDKSLYEIKILR